MYGLIIADDESMFRQGLKRHVHWARYGFRVLGEAGDGREALRLIERLKPELLLTDICMPDVNGIELMNRARRMRPDLQIAVLSAYDSFEYAQQALRHSAIGYLLKPIEPDQLDETMQKVHARISARTPAPAPPDIMPESIVERARRLIETSYHEKLTLDEVAARCFTSPSHLSAAFKGRTGQNFIDYLTSVRIRKACELLDHSGYKIQEIALRVGYEDYTYFCRVFKKAMGSTPLKYRCTLNP